MASWGCLAWLAWWIWGYRSPALLSLSVRPFSPLLSPRVHTSSSWIGVKRREEVVGPLGCRCSQLASHLWKLVIANGVPHSFCSHLVLDGYSLYGIFITEAQISLTEVGGGRCLENRKPASGGELRSISKAEFYSLFLKAGFKSKLFFWFSIILFPTLQH